MKKWWRRLRAALGMGLIWGIIWGLVGGFVMEAIVDPHGRIGDMWPPFFAMLGFAGGALFSVMLWISEGRRRFDELSLPRFTGLGALGGLLMGGYTAASLNEAAPFWVRTVVLIAPPVLCAASATCTLLLARMAEGRLNARSDVAELELTGSDAQRLPGRVADRN
jgi:drug/metabolite transporter (DMT)-like permease